MSDDKELKKTLRQFGSSKKISGKRRLSHTGGLPRGKAEVTSESCSKEEVTSQSLDFNIVVEQSPGTPSILKKRKRDEVESDGEVRPKKRIRFLEADDPQFSEDEDEN